jgi:hypothetical protein
MMVRSILVKMITTLAVLLGAGALLAIPGGARAAHMPVKPRPPATKPAGKAAASPVPADVQAAVAHGPTNVIVSIEPGSGIAKIQAATRHGFDRARRQIAIEQSSEQFRAIKHQAITAAGHGVSVVHEYAHLPAALVRVDSPAALSALAAAPGVTSVRLPRKIYPADTPPDLSLIREPEAAQSGFTGQGVSVAILDTGIDYQASNVGGAFGDCSGGPGTGSCRVDWFSDTTNTLSIDPDVDPDHHGTNVAGIVAETAPGAHLDVYRVFTPSLVTTQDSIMLALDDVAQQAAARNIRSVNMSLGDPGTYHDDTAGCSTDDFASTFLDLRALGVLPVVAAGNSAENNGTFTRGIATPACDPGAVSVGAVFDHHLSSGDVWEAEASCDPGGVSAADAVACFSQYGGPLSLLAPGVEITAAGYTVTGTSQATPHVAAAVADLVSANRSATGQQIVQALTSTGPLVTDPRDSTIIRHRLDIAAAAQAIQAAGPPAEVTDTGCTTTALPANDDGSTAAVSLPFVADFFGTSYSALYVNNNGNVTFRGPQATYTPFTIGANVPPMIAPFFADVDTRGTGSSLVTYGTTTFGSRPAFCVNWNGVGYYAVHADKTNSFQLLLVDRGDIGAGDFDIVMNYNALTWETGDASGGADGYGGTPAGAGYSAGDGNPDHFFQMPGSLTHNGLLDSNPDTGLISHSRNSLQAGRWIFPVRNGAPPGAATLTGIVRDSSGNTQPGSPVQACPTVAGSCVVGFSGADGHYTIVGVSPGSYDLTAFPPAGSTLLPGRAGPITVGTGSTVTQDLTLTGPTGPPNGTTITDHGTTANGIPVLYWTDPLSLDSTACAGGTATYTIGRGTETFRTGSMSETPAGSGHYHANVAALYPNVGDAVVQIVVNCPDGSATAIEFTVYIDPSGTVVDTNGAPISGATVTLLRSDTSSGPFTPVPDGSAVMSPSSRNNPETTGSDGTFHWDVLAGFYRVQASKTGCHAPGGTDTTVESAVYEVPPPALGLSLVLDCGETASTSSTTLTADPALAVVGQPVALTATVSGPGAVPTGTVSISTASGPISGCSDLALSAGVATCSATFQHAAAPITLTAQYSGDASHPASTGQLDLTVARAVPVLTWATPSDITYPEALGPAQLNATATVAGTFVYTIHDGGAGATGAVLHPGAGQLLDVTFTPANSDDYTSASAQVAINVRQGAQAILVDPVQPATLTSGTTTVTAHGGASGQPVSMTSSTASTCAVDTASASGATTTATVRLISAGTCTLVASQAGTADWAPAPDVTVSFPITAATAAVRVDTSISADQKAAADRLTARGLTTTQGHELILAFISADGPASSPQKMQSVTGGGLTWTLAARSSNGYGTAEVWQAYATAALNNVSVVARLSKSGFDGSITVTAFTGAKPRVGASIIGAGRTGAPSVTLTPSADGSLVWGAGHNWNVAGTVTTDNGQNVVHQYVDQRVKDTYWVQSAKATTTAAAPISMGALTPNTGRWQLAAVEIPLASG